MTSLIVALAAGTVYVISLVLLVLMLFRILLWLLRYRQPELGTRTPDGFFALVFGFGALAAASIIAYGLVTGDRSPRLALAMLGGALVNGFGWVQLRISFSVALAELRYTSARRRRLRARARQRFDPAAETEERLAERNYRDVRHWEQER
jgi:hypothetical protein